MKTNLYMIVAFIFAISTQSIAQISIDTVSTGPGYMNQKWYSLQNDEQGASQPKDNWDIAFEITGITASILANTQKTNFKIYRTPYSLANYTTLDTAGIGNWSLLYNSDESWGVGAFNDGGVFTNPNYLGWGTYDLNTHIITGDSCYVIKLSNTSFIKLKIETLAGGIYSFTYSNINGSNSQSHTINKTDYTGKNFAYFNLTSNVAVNREPLASAWDLTFVKYTSLTPSPYGVTGILLNKGVTAAQANNVLDPDMYSDFASQTQEPKMNVIGFDWKTFNLSTNSWVLSMDTVYFIQVANNDI